MRSKTPSITSDYDGTLRHIHPATPTTSPVIRDVPPETISGMLEKLSMTIDRMEKTQAQLMDRLGLALAPMTPPVADQDVNKDPKVVLAPAVERFAYLVWKIEKLNNHTADLIDAIRL